MISCTVMLLAAAFQGAPAAAAAPAATPAQDSGRVTGRWQLNAQESDDPRTQLGDTDSTRAGEQPREGGYRGRRRGGDFGGGFGGRGEGGMEGGGGQALSRGDRAAHQRMMQLVLRAPQQLELRETDTSFTLAGAEPDSIVLRTNGRKLERRGDDGVKVEYRARRRDGRLELERQVGNAGKLTETYFISPRGGQLFVIVHLLPSNGRGEVTFRRIYDPAASGQ